MFIVVVRSIVVTLLVGGLLSVLLRFFFPQVIDDPMASNATGVAIWLAAVACGVLNGVAYWKKRKKRPPIL